MSRRRASLLACALAALVPGCASSQPWDGPVAECPVCVHEGDLACIQVRVRADTPTCVVDGETYCFCSEECRADFVAHPGRYRDD